VVADEPVSALNVSVEAEIPSLITQSVFDLAILLITHDMSVVRDVCDRVTVMYLGEIVEILPTVSRQLIGGLITAPFKQAVVDERLTPLFGIQDVQAAPTGDHRRILHRVALKGQTTNNFGWHTRPKIL
jgi:ABC-type dipeptide/oligopeptide/nickel transport system ATPase component